MRKFLGYALAVSAVLWAASWKIAVFLSLWQQHKIMATVLVLCSLIVAFWLLFFRSIQRWQQRSNQQDGGSLG